VRILGLGLVAGAVLQQPAFAQDTSHVKRDTTHVVPRRDSTTVVIPAPPGADTIMRRDSIAGAARHDTSVVKLPTLDVERDTTKKDTLRAPLAHAPAPPALAIGQPLHWDRAGLFATGAISLADLLDRVPGLTTLRAGWISAPAVGAFLGDAARVRVFYDGVEWDPLDPHGGGVLDLSQIPLWTLEDLTIEQTADEVRIHMRSWRVTSTTSQTRTDVSTGDQQTNMYRGFFGKRFGHGEALQLAAQQFGTTPSSRLGSSSDQLGLVARLGWAHGAFSVDGYATRTNEHRGVITSLDRADSIPALAPARTLAYLRVGYGDPDTSSWWAQGVASATTYKYTGTGDTLSITQVPVPDANPPATRPDTQRVDLDTIVSSTQYVLSAGLTRWRVRLNATERLRAWRGATLATPSLRASYDVGPLALSALIEGKSADSISRSDVVAQFTPFSRLRFVASAAKSTDSRLPDADVSSTFLRAEAGVRLGNLWLSGGGVRRDTATLTGPGIFNEQLTGAPAGPATGAIAGVRGQLWKLINVDASAVRWSDTTAFYQPRYQTRSEVFISNSFLKRFPSNDFHLLASVVHEYRSGVSFPSAGGAIRTAGGYRTISTLVEVRILSAVVSWQFRNFLGAHYQQVPNFEMPHQTNFYGVRWEFWD
jgi:hypothetical protein